MNIGTSSLTTNMIIGQRSSPRQDCKIIFDTVFITTSHVLRRKVLIGILINACQLLTGTLFTSSIIIIVILSAKLEGE